MVPETSTRSDEALYHWYRGEVGASVVANLTRELQVSTMQRKVQSLLGSLSPEDRKTVLESIQAKKD